MLFRFCISLVFFVAAQATYQVKGDENSVDGEIFYSVLGSQFIRPNSKYFVSANLHNSDQTVALQVSIQNVSSKSEILMSQQVTLDPFSSKTIEFETGSLLNPLQTNYLLVAEGLSGLIFRNETTLWLNEKTVSIHVQTDRPEYAVGDLLKFRVLILDIDTKPVAANNTLSVIVKVYLR